MLEQNSVASSYIPTQGSAVTRVAETASGAGNSEVFNDSEGVLFADIAALADDGSIRHISLSDGSTSNRIIMALDSNNQIRYYLEGTGGNILIQFTVTSILLPTKILIKYKFFEILHHCRRSLWRLTWCQPNESINQTRFKC